MTDEELKIVENIAKKLERYMIENNQTIFSLAKQMEFDRQPFYRVIHRKGLPTLTTISLISKLIKCSIHELISDYTFIDIKTYKDITLNKKMETRRIYLMEDDYQYIKNYDVFGIKSSENLKIYHKTDKFINDGIYVVKYNSEITEMDILSAGSKFVIAHIAKKEERIDSSLLTTIAKQYKTAPIIVDAFST